MHRLFFCVTLSFQNDLPVTVHVKLESWVYRLTCKLLILPTSTSSFYSKWFFLFLTQVSLYLFQFFHKLFCASGHSSLCCNPSRKKEQVGTDFKFINASYITKKSFNFVGIMHPFLRKGIVAEKKKKGKTNCIIPEIRNFLSEKSQKLETLLAIFGVDAIDFCTL